MRIPLTRLWLPPLSAVLATLLVGFLSRAGETEPKVQPAKFVLEWGGRGDAPGKFDFPIGIAFDKDGQILVTDFYNARVQCFNSDGKYLSSFKVLPNPGGIASDQDGNV